MKPKMIPGWSPGRKWFVFSLLLLCHIYFFQAYPNFISPNEYSRFLLTSAIVDYGTVQIDQPIRRFGDTQDKSQYQGHFYSDKAIGTSLFSVPFYVALKSVGAVLGIAWTRSQLLILLRIFCVTIPSLIFLNIFSRFCHRIHPDGYFVPALLFLFLFGTTEFTYSLQLISHPLFGIFLFLSFYCIYRFQESPGQDRHAYLVSGGMFSGLALITEYAAIFPVTAIFFYMLWTISRKQKAAYYALAVIPFVLLSLTYNYTIFGTPFDVTYHHQNDPFHASGHAQGFVGIGLPKWEALYGLLFSHHHGLFFLSPFLIFGLPGFFMLGKRPGFLRETWLIFAVILSCVLFYCSFSNWIAGWNFGPRYLTSILPFLVIPVLAFFGHPGFRTNGWIRFLGIFTGIISVVFVTIGTITFPYPPDQMKNPLFVLSVPLFFRGAVSENLGMLLQLSPAGSIILFYALLLVTFFAMVLPSRFLLVPNAQVLGPWILSASLAGAILLMGFKTTEDLTAFDHYARGSIYFYLARYDHATEDLQSALSRAPDAHLKHLIVLRLREISYFENRRIKLSKTVPWGLSPIL